MYDFYTRDNYETDKKNKYYLICINKEINLKKYDVIHP